ncbi:MAG TPA: ABC transporter ATP-binding protein/permease [Acetobacteraceae bacterium]|nr:ABC transporter ATP-binding protein/permease [Acetobacteraceae bacterium]
MRRIGHSLREAWALARPYFFSEERWVARGLLATLVVLALALVGMSVLLSFWNREFFNALEARDQEAYSDLLFTWRQTESGLMPGFVWIAGAYILIAVYQLYLNQALQIRWRRWLTRRYLDRWLDQRAYYRMSLGEGAADNPDQRIADDIKLFVGDSLSLSLELLSSVVTLFSFVVVLWSLSGPMDVFGVAIPGYLVWVALLYAVAGTTLTHLVGRRLIPLNFHQQRVEADFRFALVRLRENAEGIALHGGEADEKRGLLARFGAVMENWWRIMVTTKQLTFLTSGYTQVAIVFPFVVAAPAFFAGRIPLGGLTQTASAFGSVQTALSFFVDFYRRIAEWRATVDRLTGFTQAIDAAEAMRGGPVPAAAGDALVLEGLTLALPDGRVLLRDAALRVGRGEAVLLTGASGGGKSTLFRTIAGIWPFGAGRVVLPAGARALFLPQRPYIPLGTLRRAVCYPLPVEDVPADQVGAALEAVGLTALRARLDEEQPWERRLSGGEQQRLAFARALLVQPDLLFLDEATASLDPAAEAHLYALLRERLPGTMVLSIAHRPAVRAFHDRELRLEEARLVSQA